MSLPPAPDRAESPLVAEVADAAFDLLGSGRQTAPFSADRPAFSMADAYLVTDAVRRRREAAGSRVVGRKIGFTNRTIWDEYGVRAPIWGYVFDTTQHELAEHADQARPFPLAGIAEPRIEPEIVFGFASAPDPAMDERAILGCVAWVAHGFEIVQSIHPDWRFAAPDTVAAYGLHGALLVGPRHALAGEDLDAWARDLAAFEIDILRDGEALDHGRAANVLDGPLAALRHFVGLLAADPVNPGIAAGEVVTTGTLTKAFPVAPGQVWSTRLHGLPLAGIRLALG